MNASEFDLMIQKFIEASIQSFKKVNYSDQSDIEEHNFDSDRGRRNVAVPSF